MLKKKYAGIQYLGESGISSSCKEAIIKLIHSGDTINEVKILTARKNNYSQYHCFIIIDSYGTVTAIKKGFTSGYSGEGPKTFACTLQLLETYTDEINEFIVDLNILEKIDESSLTVKDIEYINSQKKVLPRRWRDYTYSVACPDTFKDFPQVLPLALIDKRLIKYALSFPNNPDHAILNSYRLLESIVRERSNLIHESSTKLFKQAFLNQGGILHWENIEEGEQIGRANLFVNIFLAYRNNRAHKTPKHNLKNDLREFLMINHLFILESEAVIRT